MNVRSMIPVAAAAVLLAATANAQTAGVSATKARVAPAAAPVAVPQASAGIAAAESVSPTAGVAAVGQAPPAPPAPPAAVAPAAPRAPQAPRTPRPASGEATTAEAIQRTRGQLINIRLEFTVTDQIGSAPPVKKTITMNVADGESGRIRTNADVFRKNTNPTVVPLSVDAYPLVEGGKIRLRASLEYQLLSPPPEPDMPAGKTSITQSVTSILSDGVPAILSQSADPLTDRKVTLEVKATIIK